MSEEIGLLLEAVGLFLGIVIAQLVGRWIGARRTTNDPEGARAGVGAVEGAVFGLMGLLVAFSFSGAATRFDARRELIVQETNAIGTAWLRLDLLPAGSQPALRQSFRDYVDSRIATYRKLPDVAAARDEFQRSLGFQGAIWSAAVATCREPGMQQCTMLLLPALNEMIDIATTRAMAMEMHPPGIVFVMLFGFTLVSALLAGSGMASSRWISWLHTIGFGLVMAIAVFVILDLEYPRRGTIRVDAFDHALVDLRATMN